MSNLQSDIREIVHENSGGVKFLALLADLACRRMDVGLGPESAEVVVDEIEHDPTLKIHDYVWHMAGPTGNVEGGVREKMFVYQV